MHVMTKNSLRMPLVMLAALAALAIGCGGDDGGGGGVGGTTDAGADTAADGSGEGSGETDAGVTDTGGGGGVVDESGLRVVFTREATSISDTLPDYTQLMVAEPSCKAPSTQVCDPGACPLIEVAPRYEDEPLCQVGCQVTSGMEFVVFLDPNNAQTLRFAPLDDGFQLAADSEVIAEEVNEYQVAGTFVAYRVNNDVNLYDLTNGDDGLVASFLNRGGGFHLSSDGTQLFINTVVSLTAMEMEVYPTNGDPGQPVFDFVSGEEQGTGSDFSGREPMALSPDGTRLAIMTTARNSYNPCSSNADCTGPGQACLQSASPPRCVAYELTLNIMNIDSANRLNTPCDDDSSCGDDQFCDVTAPDQNGQGRCLPTRFVLGPTNAGSCDNWSPGQYTDSRQELAWRDNDTILALLEHDCEEGLSIPVTDVMGFGLSGAAFTGIEVNPGEDHGGCFDEVEQCFTVEDCRIEVSNMSVSPGGSTIAMVADSFSSSRKNELWITDAVGGAEKRLMTTSIDYEILQVSMHTVE